MFLKYAYLRYFILDVNERNSLLYLLHIQFTYITYIILLHISIFMNNDILCSSNVRSLWIIFPIYYIFDKDIDIFSHYRINSYYLLRG